MIKAIIFDWGGVLIENPSRGLITYFSNYFSVTKEEFIHAFQPYHSHFQKGIISEKNLWDKVCSALDRPRPTEDSLWYEAFQEVYIEQKAVFSLATALKNNGYKIGFLSNTEDPAMRFFHEQHYEMFDITIFSCNEGTRKPEKRIYEITIEQLGVEPTEAVFIDDKQAFITGAQTIGLHTILFRNIMHLKENLLLYSIKLN